MDFRGSSFPNRFSSIGITLADGQDFCSERNVDDCLTYLSQKFISLGFPSINSNDIQLYKLNCDIVIFFNIIHDLLISYCNSNEIITSLEERINTTNSNFDSLRKKYANIKNTQEQSERKITCLQEKERQLLEKNKKLEFQLKTQKDEIRRLTHAIQNQKVSFQHELKKRERQSDQMKDKLQRAFVDKSCNSKHGHMELISGLPKKDRGKWNTAASSHMHLEDMYSSVIANYNINCQQQLTEISSLQESLKTVQNEISVIMTTLQEKVNGCPEESAHFVAVAPCQNITLEKAVLSNIKMFKEVLKTTLMTRCSNCCNNLTDTIEIVEAVEIENKLGKPKLSLENQWKILNEEKAQLVKEKYILTEAMNQMEKERSVLQEEKVELFNVQIKSQIARLSCADTSLIPSLPIFTSDDGKMTILNDESLRQYSDTPLNDTYNSNSLPSWVPNFNSQSASDDLKEPQSDIFQTNV